MKSLLTRLAENEEGSLGDVARSILSMQGQQYLRPSERLKYFANEGMWYQTQLTTVSLVKGVEDIG